MCSFCGAASPLYAKRVNIEISRPIEDGSRMEKLATGFCCTVEHAIAWLQELPS